jgi:hypothetical protein
MKNEFDHELLNPSLIFVIYCCACTFHADLIIMTLRQSEVRVLRSQQQPYKYHRPATKDNRRYNLPMVVIIIIYLWLLCWTHMSPVSQSQPCQRV